MTIAPELLQALIESREAYLHNFWATLGFLVGAIGWFITSKDARAFLHEQKNNNVRRICSGSVIALVVIHVIVLINASSMSQELACAIRSLSRAGTDVGTQAIVEFYQVPWYWVLVDGIINSLLAAILIVLINNKYQMQTPDNQTA